MIAREFAKKYKYLSLQRKLWSRIQVSKSVQRELHSSMYTSMQNFFFFFEPDVISKEWSRGNGVTVFQGYNGPGLVGYLRWKLFTSSLACSSSAAGNHLELSSVSLYPNHMTL